MIAHLSKKFHSIVLAIVLKCSCFRIIFSCHQLVYEGIASFYDFGYFLNLSFFDFFIEDFFILNVFSSVRFFCCLSDIKLFAGWWLDESIIWLFGCWHDIGNLLLWHQFEDFLHFVGFDFSINYIELLIIKNKCGLILNKGKYWWEELIFTF